MKKQTQTLLWIGAGAVIAYLIYKKMKSKGMSGMGDLGRASCTECVEKHLGAAAVLTEECKAGYPQYRLRVIGHLHEAEDESREWPELSATIREARIAYQRTGACPDFDALAKQVEGVRGAKGAQMSGLDCVPCAALMLL